MRHLMLVAVLCAMLVVAVGPGVASAATDPLDGLNDEEKAYVSHMRSVSDEVQFVLRRQGEQYVGGAGGALQGEGLLDSREVASILRRWKSELSSYALEYRATPPTSIQDLAGTFEGFARTLEGAYSSSLDVLQEEDRLELLHDGRNWLSGLLGEAPFPDELRPTLKAKLVASVAREQVRLEDRLADIRAALDATVAEIQEAQAAGEDFLNLFFDECFIATAAYGTKTAAEIDVLRDFRDRVLMCSPEGRDLVGFYYAASPPLAAFIAEHELVRTVVRECLIDPIVWATSLLQPL